MSKFCPECGNKVKSERSEFCDMCGGRLSAGPSQQASLSETAREEEKPARREEEKPEKPAKREAKAESGSSLDYGTLAKTGIPAGLVLGVISALFNFVPPVIGSLFMQGSYDLILSIMQYVVPFLTIIDGLIAGALAAYMFKMFKIEHSPAAMKKYHTFAGALAGAVVGVCAGFVNFVFPLVAIITAATSAAAPDIITTILNAAWVLLIFVVTIVFGAIAGSFAAPYARNYFVK